MNGISGPLIDRLASTGYALCMLWWSVSPMLHVFATGGFSLGYCLLLGMGEAGYRPAAVKVVAEWFPEHERALASGIFNSGATVGVILRQTLRGLCWARVAIGFSTHWLAGICVAGCVAGDIPDAAWRV